MFGKKKKEKKKPAERFVSLTANGVTVEAMNFALSRDEDGTPRLDVYTRDVCEALHYSEIDFLLRTDKKQVEVKAEYRQARSEKKFKVYTYDIKDFNQYYI